MESTSVPRSDSRLDIVRNAFEAGLFDDVEDYPSPLTSNPPAPISAEQLLSHSEWTKDGTDEWNCILASVPRTESEKKRKMYECEHLEAHRSFSIVYVGTSVLGKGHLHDRNECQVCGWFHDGWFSPIKFSGCCGRMSKKKRNGMTLYCMRPGSKCAYHKAVSKKRDPWV